MVLKIMSWENTKNYKIGGESPLIFSNGQMIVYDNQAIVYNGQKTME